MAVTNATIQHMFRDILSSEEDKMQLNHVASYLQLALFGIVHPAHKLFDQSPVNILLIKYKENVTRPRNTSFLLALEPYGLQFNFTIPNIRKFMFQRYGIEVLPQ